MQYKKILTEEKNFVGKIIMNDPPVNVVDIEMATEMNDALGKFAEDMKIKVKE